MKVQSTLIMLRKAERNEHMEKPVLGPESREDSPKMINFSQYLEVEIKPRSALFVLGSCTQ